MAPVALKESVSQRAMVRIAAELTIALFGVALIVCAIRADHSWFDLHFLPTFFAPFEVYIVAVRIGRILLALLGVALALYVRPRFGRLVARKTSRELTTDVARILAALILALGVSEWALRHTVFGLAAEETPPQVEPKRLRDPQLGWTQAPARAGRDEAAGRVIEYAFDANGYRVRHEGENVDPERPSVLFAGESIMVGHGLTWDESVPGRVQALLGIQSANLAVEGFATDQAYLRLKTELPRFLHPAAVVTLFAPALFDRNLDIDRPHLGPGFVWLPGRHRSSLVALARWMVPYHSEAAIERNILLTREVLRATVDLARARGAVCLILVPQFTPEQPAEREVRSRILDEAGLSYERVELDPSWHIPWDRHPDARGARAMALAVANRLRGELKQ